MLKSLDQFQWNWPKKINRPQIQNLFRLAFIATQTNIVLIGNVGVGKTHLAIALGHAACLNGHSVLFTTAVDIINTLAAARAIGQLKPRIPPLPEARHIDCRRARLPDDRQARRRPAVPYHPASATSARQPVITSNRAYKHWSQIFNNDTTLTSALLDRVLPPRRHGHHRRSELPHERRN